jgi:ABC-type cobalamin/Fe3+-siderophores transport system ATPase subunit
MMTSLIVKNNSIAIPHPSENNLLTAKALQLTLGKKIVIDSVDVVVQKNEFVGLIGPNGAGKSSLLRMLAGLIEPQAGEVELAINECSSAIAKILPQQRARVMAYLAQHETPVWPLSVKNLVALGRSPWNGSLLQATAADEVAIVNAMHMTDVHLLADRPITELSGGELQRALLARVFAGSPQLILADEPIAALDLYHQLHVMELLQAQAKNGGAVIAALHDLSLAARFCSRLILLHEGKVIAEGEPLTVLTPENISAVYGVSVYLDCREEGVIIIPRMRMF